MPRNREVSSPRSKQSRLAILLCTCDGQQYLPDQLDSFAAQRHSNWEVRASDDGSTDGTLAVLESYRQAWPEGRMTIQAGPVQGHVANFLSLTCDPRIQADFYAYSDQDDIWDEDKLERAVRYLEVIPQDVPALYCARTRLVDVDNNEIGFSPLFSKPPSFANALAQNIGGGNTMVFNNAARALLIEAGERVNVMSHDWWLYMVVAGCGGKVVYDSVPSLRYRQHSGNVVGMNATWSARFERIHLMFQGYFRSWNDRHVDALRLLNHRLTPENRETLDRFVRARKKSFIPRLIELKRCGIYRQTMLGNLGLFMGGLFGRF